MGKNNSTYCVIANVGSSSVKHLLIEVRYNSKNGKLVNYHILAKCSGERLNARGSEIKVTDHQKKLLKKVQGDYLGFVEATEVALDGFKQAFELEKITLIANRAVNIGRFMEPCFLTEETEKEMRNNISRAPEHNPGALDIIDFLKKKLPQATQVLIPDSAPHATIPKVAYTYGIPLEISEKLHIRKMGFHGSSVQNALDEVSKLTKKPLKTIVAHLGNGCSVTCAKDGQVMDTSMGMTPLTGCLMGTRSGDVDPALIELLIKEEGMQAEEVLKMLNKSSGLLGIGGISADFRDNLLAAFDGNQRAKLAIKVFIYKVSLEIAKYTFPIGGMNQLIFSGGIGENSDYVRKQICDNLTYLGVKINDEKNHISSGKIACISDEESAVDVFIIPADEATAMLKMALKLITKEENQE